MAKVIRLKRSKNYIPSVILLLLFLAAGFAWLATPTIDMLKARALNSTLKRELVAIKEKNIQLKEGIVNLKKDRYVELVARKQLGLVKENEQAFVVVSKKMQSKIKAKPKPKSWWDRIRSMF